jgi:hypothetical protein
MAKANNVTPLPPPAALPLQHRSHLVSTEVTTSVGIATYIHFIAGLCSSMDDVMMNLSSMPSSTFDGYEAVLDPMRNAYSPNVIAVVSELLKRHINEQNYNIKFKRHSSDCGLTQTYPDDTESKPIPKKAPKSPKLKTQSASVSIQGAPLSMQDARSMLGADTPSVQGAVSMLGIDTPSVQGAVSMCPIQGAKRPAQGMQGVWRKGQGADTPSMQDAVSMRPPLHWPPPPSSSRSKRLRTSNT